MSVDILLHADIGSSHVIKDTPLVGSMKYQALLLLSVVLQTWSSTSSRWSATIVLDVSLDQGSLSRAVDAVLDNRQHVWSLHWITLNSTSPGHAAKTVWKMLNADIQVLVSVLKCSQRMIVSYMTGTLQIPHLSVDLDPCPSRTPEEFTLHLTQEYTNIAVVLFDILQATGQYSISIDLSHKLDFIQFHPLMVQLSSLGAKNVFLNIQENDRNETISKQRGIFVIVQNNLHTTKQGGDDDGDQVHPKFPRVMLTGQVSQSCARQMPANHSDVLLLEITPKAPAQPYEMRVVRHLTVLQRLVGKAALMVVITTDNEDDEGNMKGSNWLGINHQQRPCGGGSLLLEELKTICGADTSNRCGRQTRPVEYNILDVNECSRSQLPIGEWTKSKGLTLHPQSPSFTNRLFPNKLTDFGGTTLRVGIHTDIPPHVSRKQSDNNSLHGIDIDILDELANALNFKYMLMEPEDGLFGAKLSNGSWSGVVGMVSKGEVDLGVGPLTINAERSEVAVFTTPFMQDSFGILTPRPKEAQNLFQVFQPFDLFIWLAVSLSVLLACFVFATIALTTSVHTNNGKHELLRINVNESVFLILSSFFEQGPTLHPTSVSARCFLSFWFVFTILTMTTYTAHLAAVLTVSTPVRPINSLQDLVDRSDMKVVVRAGGSAYSFITQSRKPLHKTVASRIQPVTTFTHVISDVRDGKVSILSDRNVLEYIASQSCGEARVANEKIVGYSAGFLVPKNSPYKQAIDLKIQKMVESGMIQRLERKWNSPPLDCTTNSSGKVRQLTLGSLGGIFIVFGVVTLAALCIFTLDLTTRCCP